MIETLGGKSARTIVTGLLFVICAFLLLLLTPLQRLDFMVYDLHADLLRHPPHKDVRIVAIDENSLKALGRWPWSRAIHGALIEKLTAAGVHAIGMNILFLEPDHLDPDSDQVLAETMAASGKVVLPIYPAKDPQTQGMSEVAPIGSLASTAASLGHVDVELDVDGISRRVFLRGGVGTPSWSALPLAMVQLSQPDRWKDIPGRISPDDTRKHQDLWQRNHQVMIPFTGPPGHFETLSYIDILKTPAEKLALQGKWVLVGATAVGMGEHIATPTSSNNHQMSGVEYHANVLDALLNRNSIEPLGFRWNLGLTLIPVILTLVLYLVMPTWAGGLIWGGMMLGTLALSTLILLNFSIWFPPVTALLLVSLSYPIWQAGRLFDAKRQSISQRACIQATYDALDQVVIVTDTDSRLQYMSSAAERLTGYAQEKVLGQQLSEFLILMDETGNGAFDQGCERNQNGEEGNRYLMSHPSGNVRALWVSARATRDRTGHQRGWIVTLHDKERKRKERAAQQNTTLLDPCTSLPGRALLMIQLKQLFERAQRGQFEVGLLFISLERMQQLDLDFSPSDNNQLLLEIVERIKGVVRKSDILARNGSDHFVVTLEDLGYLEAAEQVAAKIVSKLREPFMLDNQMAEVAANIGISHFPRDGKDPEELLKRAYTAIPGKFEGSTGRYEVYSRQRHERIDLKRFIERGLIQALKNDELVLHYQPQIEIATGAIIAAEALLRWRDGTGKSIPPATFIPVAEECGLIHEIGEWVFNESCEQLKRWQGQGADHLRLSINLSPIQLQRLDLISNYLATIDANHLDPRHIELEITEGTFIEHTDSASSMLRQLQTMGGSIAVDDFGTGYSSFSNLKQLPVNRLKIDRSLVSDLVAFQDDAIILRTIVSMAHELNLEVVAEGVETQEQADLLKQENCDLIQGYLISRPLPADSFMSLFSSWSAKRF
ncbi:MAG: EAL domain-containing protein [Gammaproteobacteria bacterium]|nr:EAL domain-containing protein [Gammaproteobacteria bacterium]